MIGDIQFLSEEQKSYLSNHIYFEKVRSEIKDQYDLEVNEIYVSNEYFSNYDNKNDNYTALLSFATGKGRFFVYYHFNFYPDLKEGECWEYIDLYRETGTVYLSIPNSVPDKYKAKTNILYPK